MDAANKLLETFNNLINKATGWVDQLFGIFGVYTDKYSKLIVYGGLLYVAAKIFKVNFKLGGGK